MNAPSKKNRHQSGVQKIDLEFTTMTPFRSVGPFPEAFINAPIHVKGKVDQPVLGCPDCIRNYIRGGAAALKPHLSRKDIIQTLKCYTRIFEVSDARFEELVDEGFRWRS
jgi:hypothetical protein